MSMSRSDYRQELTNKIIEQLEKGSVPWQREWSNTDDRLYSKPYNPTSGKAYRGINSLYLHMVAMDKGYTDPRWCTYKQAVDNGWHIKKGEHGAKVEFWKFKEKQEVIDENGNKSIEEVELKRPIVMHFTVFNAAQIEGMPEFQKKELHSWESIDKAEKIIKNSGANIEFKADVTPHYSVTNDKIVMPLREQFHSAESYYATALHELGHWTGSSSRLNRDIANSFGSPEYAKEELRAELSSFFVTSDIGISNDIKNHSSYIDSWIKVLKNDKNEIFRAAADAEKIADYVLAFEKEKNIENQQKDRVVTDKETAQNKIAITDIRLMINYNDREKAKALGAKWDKELKTWYAPKGENLSKFSPFMGEKVVNLKDLKIYGDYSDRDVIKSHGGLWNPDQKEWYVPAGSDIKNLPEKFLVEKEKIEFPKQSFAEFAKENGLIIEGEPIADGKFHRVPVEGGKPNSKDGSYILHDDSLGKAGWIKNFKTGFESSYGESGTSRGSYAKAVKQDIEKELKVRQEERDTLYEATAKKADYLVKNVFIKAEKHPYLDAKGIQPHNTFIDKSGALIVPLKNINGEIRTFQRINEAGAKSYISDSSKKGAFHTFGTIKDRCIICEGFATGASIYESTKIPVISAMDSGNLESVAVSIRNKYGDSLKIGIAADNDHMTKNNPGVTFAEKAAKAVNATVIIPKFNEQELQHKLSDFNDLARSRGNSAVKEQISEQAKSLTFEKAKEIER